ncbi:Aerotaxis receptor Aer [hydrothermal vent metagenome]|uniref:Aerotaxis receptor Aer n=1 Tax=hydrothermal vent metagenome TaxID=652676 RepID=A0A1W1C893_9ZZZZ
MFYRLKVKVKVLIPFLIFVVLFLMLTTSYITNYYSQIDSLKELQKSVVLSTKISQLIHETQKERGYSSGYVTNHGERFEKELELQKQQTDKKIVELRGLLSKFNNPIIITSIQKPLQYLVTLKSIRKKVKNLQINSHKVILFYSTMNDAFLNIFVKLAKSSQVANITQELIAYSDFLYAKENAGIERALGTAIVSQNYFDKNQKVTFTNLVEAQRLYLKMFLQLTSQDIRIFYKKVFTGNDINNVNKVRAIILSKESHFQIDPLFWFDNITSKIDKLKKIDNYLEKHILKNIDEALRKNYGYFLIFIFLNILGVSVFVGIVITFLKLIHNELELKKINDKYIISSVTDAKGRILDVSDAFCMISGYSKKELIGKTHNIVRHPDMPKSVFREMWKALKQKKSWQGKVKNLKKNGDEYWVYANIESILNNKGEIKGYASIRVDITDSVHLQEELENNRKKDRLLLQQSKHAQMGEMLAMIAHQWRQPLSAISAASITLNMKAQMDMLEKNVVIEVANKISDLTQHLSKTIDDFRDFFKNTKEKKEITYQELINKTLEIVEVSLKNKNITIIREEESKEVFVTYTNELKQVVLNLIKNAEDILLEKNIKEPYIKIVTEGNKLKIYDNGGGIPEDIIDKIFDPYFSTKSLNGTGLGLYMSKTIIEEHCEGKLTAHNEADGAVFVVELSNGEKDEKNSNR